MIKLLTILQNIDYFENNDKDIDGDNIAMYFFLNEIVKLFP
jgi:hypothetical protein